LLAGAAQRARERERERERASVGEHARKLLRDKARKLASIYICAAV